MLLIPHPTWDFDTGRIDFNPGSRHGTVGRLASQITPQLYLSDYWTARDPHKLKELGITHVVSLLDFSPEIPDCISTERRLHINIYDEPKANILRHLSTTTPFIVAAIQEDQANKVLVHCMMGISRSPTVVCAYLVATTDMTAPESITHVQAIRSVVRPNFGFRQQLEQYSTRFVKTKSFVWAESLSFSGIASWIRTRKKSEVTISSSSSTHKV